MAEEQAGQQLVVRAKGTVRSFVNVRATPTVHSLSIGQLRPGASLPLIERGTAWHHVHTADGDGFVSAELTDIVAGDTRPPEEPARGPLANKLAEIEQAIAALKPPTNDSATRSIELANLVAQLVGVTLAGIAVLLVVAGGFGFFELQRQRETRRKVEASLNKSKETAESAAAHVEGIRQSMQGAFAALTELLDKTPEIEAKWWMHGEPPKIDDERRVQWEDMDALWTVADRLGVIPDVGKVAQGYWKLAKYWLLKQDHDRAELRARRSVELAPSAKGVCVLAKALVYREPPKDIPDALASLDRATDLLRRENAGKKDELEVLEIRGFALMVGARYPDAIRAWQIAREMDQALASEKSEPESDYASYNLLCTYALMGDHRSAIDVLRAIAPRGENARTAIKDPDLANLRQDAQYGREFHKIVAAVPGVQADAFSGSD